jgi:hypothetical protein
MSLVRVVLPFGFVAEIVTSEDEVRRPIPSAPSDRTDHNDDGLPRGDTTGNPQASRTASQHEVIRS